MTVLYIVRIPKQDEEGEYMEDHYFKESCNARQFALDNGIGISMALEFDCKLADQIAED